MVFVLTSTETELKENSQEDFDLYKEMILVLNDSIFELNVHKWMFVLLFLLSCFSSRSFFVNTEHNCRNIYSKPTSEFKLIYDIICPCFFYPLQVEKRKTAKPLVTFLERKLMLKKSFIY